MGTHCTHVGLEVKMQPVTQTLCQGLSAGGVGMLYNEVKLNRGSFISKHCGVWSTFFILVQKHMNAPNFLVKIREHLCGSCCVTVVHPMMQLVQGLILKITSVFSDPVWLQFLETAWQKSRRNRVKMTFCHESSLAEWPTLETLGSLWLVWSSPSNPRVVLP